MIKKDRSGLTRFSLQIGGLAFLTFALFVGVTYFYFLPMLSEVLVDKKKEMLRTNTELVLNDLHQYHRQVENGEITEQKAKQLAAQHIRHCRYGKENKDYFWINDMRPVMIVHPYRPELEGQNLSDYKDPGGTRVFMDIIRAVKDDGEGFVRYEWQWKDREQYVTPKISYVKKFEPWNWVIGTGMYVKAVHREINTIENRLLWVFSGIMLIITGILLYIVHRSSHAEKQRRQSEAENASQKELLSAILETSREGVIVTHYNGTFSYTNNNFAEMWNLSEPVIRSKDTRQLKNALWNQVKFPETVVATMQRFYQSSQEWLGKVYLKDGRVFEHFSAPLGQTNQHSGRVWSIQDITQQVRDNAHIRHLNSILSVIREVDQLIVDELDIKNMMQKACNSLVENRLYFACSIGIREGSVINSYVHAGAPSLHQNWSVDVNGESENAPQCIKDAVVSHEQQMLDREDRCIACDYMEGEEGHYISVITPMIRRHTIVGILFIAIERERGITAEEKELIREIADDLSYAREKIQAQRALVDSEKRFRNLSDMLPETIFEADFDLNITYVNKTGYQMFQLTEQDIAEGINGLDLFPEHERENVFRNYQNKIKGFYYGPTEYTMKKYDGTLFPVLFHTVLMYQDEDIVGVRGFIVDLTDKYKTEEALQKSEYRAQVLVDYSPNIIMRFQQGQCTFANPAAQKILNYSLEECKTRAPENFIAGEHLDYIRQMIEQSYKEDTKRFEIKLQAKDGTEILSEVYIIHLNDKNNFLFIAQDITDQKETERKVLNAIIETQEQERKMFAENLHDELGPFLSGIKHYVDEIVRDDLTGDEKQELVRDLKKMSNEAIENTRTISNQLMPNVLVNYGLYRALKHFIDSLSKTSTINIHLDFNKPEKNYSQKLELGLYRVTIELINNTLKHAQASSIGVHFYDDNDQLNIRYKDNGIGTNIERDAGEEGMGLQNIKSRVKLFNGDICFKSQPGAGFEVRINIPLDSGKE